ncbi:MAG: branched-chain amino acid ABC transporter permease [Polyangiales bacterium]
MQMFLQAAISGLLMGGVYALIGIGLTIIFGVMQVINFAHGDLVMVGMYATWLLFTRVHVDPFVSVLLTAPLLFGLGALMQRVFIQRVVGKAAENQILLTIGLGLLLSNTAMLIFTSDYQIVTTTYSSSSFRLGGISISQPLLFAFIITLVIAGSLYAFLMRTDTGQAIRATAQDREAAQLMGIDVTRMSALAFGIGAALAGTAGALIAPTYYIFPQVGHTFTLKSFVIVVLGGMGSVVGATLGGILIGFIESLAALYLSTGLKESVVFALFLVLLLFRPAGLFGKVRT